MNVEGVAGRKKVLKVASKQGYQLMREAVKKELKEELIAAAKQESHLMKEAVKKGEKGWGV